MQRAILMIPLLGLTACMSGGSTSAGVVYAEPVEYVYVEPVDHVVVVSRQVLVTNGYTVYRVTRSGPSRVIWARRGSDEMVRIFVRPSGGHVAVHGVLEVRERNRHRDREEDDDDDDRRGGWERRGSPHRVLAAINGRLTRRGRDN